MTLITQRFATEPGDYELLQRAVREETSFLGCSAHVTPGDLDWWLNVEDDPVAKMNTIPIWLEDGRIVAWAYAFKEQFDLFLNRRRYDLLPGMIAWAEQSVRASGATEMELYANDSDQERASIYTAAGFSRTETHFTFRQFPLDGDLPEPRLPNGYTFRDMSTVVGDDLERRVELHRVVWAPSRWTPDKHARLMKAANYRAELDLIVVAPNGDFAAYSILWYEPEQRIGLFEPVGCHPDYRQRGLTRAVMHEGLRRFKAAGAEMAYVNSWHESIPANRLYESSGFAERSRLHQWVKAL